MDVFTVEELREYAGGARQLYPLLKNKTFLITGGTGFLGTALVSFLLFLDREEKLGLKIVLCVRNVDKAEKLFGKNVRIIKWKAEDKTVPEENVDYIIHAACPTQSKYLTDCPVDVIKTSVLSTLNLLEFSRKHKNTFLYLSSMEVYGEVKQEVPLTEEDLGYINLYKMRNSYPESKRICEMMVSAYASQYNLDTKSIRLAQVIGPGIGYDDPKVFAMMAKAAVNNERIRLQTKGDSKHPYLYVLDAVIAILYVLFWGECGVSYNAANPNTYCSIYEMAKMVSDHFGGDECIVEIMDDNPRSFPETSTINMDCTALISLGWKPKRSLLEMYSSLIRYFERIRRPD